MIIEEGRMVLRWYDPAHGKWLSDLHRCCFPQENWTQKDFDRFMAKRSSNVVKVLVREGDNEPIVYGSFLYTLEVSTCRIRRVAVWPDYRRQGLASFMLNTMISPRSPVRRSVFTARIGRDNFDAKHFFESMGFVTAGEGENLIDLRFERQPVTA